MKLDIKTAESVMCGAASVKEQNGKYILCRFTDSELATTDNPNRYYSSGVKLAICTDASAVKMKFTVKNLAVRSYFALDVYCNGTLSGSITNCNDTAGGFAEKTYSLGDFAGGFSLPDGEKTLEIVLPHSVKCEIEYIELENEETYGERFEIPTPDELVFISWFSGGEVFRSGACWSRGLGKIFYFRPGHEAYPTYYRDDIRQVIANAVCWAKPSGGPRPTLGNVKVPYEKVALADHSDEYHP